MNQNNLLMSMLLGQLKNKNPGAYNEFQSLMNSGKSPEVILNELLRSGKFTQEQLNQAKNMLNSGNIPSNPTPTIKRF